MNRNRKIFTLLALAAIAFALVFLALPNFLARGLQSQIGNGLIINGTVRLMVLPSFGIVANGVAITSETGKLKAAIKATTAEIQIPITALLLATLKPSRVILSQADITITMGNNSKTELQPETSHALSIEVKDSALKFGTAKFEGISAEIETSDTGETEIKGKFLRDGQYGNVVLNLASMRRLSEDGSPFDGAITFASTSLTLAGQLRFLDGFVFNGRGDLISWENALKISGALSGTDKTLQWPDADVAINNTIAKGSIAISNDTLIANLVTSSVKVSDFNNLWSEAQFWEFGRTGRFDLEIEDLRLRDVQLGKSSISVTLDDNASQVKLSTVDGIRGQVDLVSDGDGKTMDMKFAGQTIELSKLVPLVFSKGKMVIELAMRSDGKSPAELLSKLSGTAKIALKDSEVLGADVADFVGTISKEVITGWPNKTKKSLLVRAGSAAFQIDDGIAITQDITFSGPGYQVTGGGEIDVLRAAVDLKIDPILIADDKAKLRLPVEIAIVGPWSTPQIQPDIEGILTDPRAAFARLKSEGFVSGSQKRLPKKVPTTTKAN